MIHSSLFKTKSQNGIRHDDEHCRGVFRGHSESSLGHRDGRTQVAHTAEGEERSGTGVLDHRGGRRTWAALRQGVRPAPGYTGAVGHQQPQQ